MQSLEAVQSRLLRRLVRHAARHVPFYARLFVGVRGLRPEAVRGIADLEHLPLVQRADLQLGTAKERCSSAIDYDTYIIRRTGGSSGIPLAIDPANGSSPSRRWYGSERGGGSGCVHPTSRSRSRRRTPPSGIGGTGTNSLVFSGCDIWTFMRLRICSRARCWISSPMCCGGRPRFSRRSRRSSHRRGVPPVCVSCSRPASGSNRKRERHLEAALRAPVHDLYGATEAGCIAWRCPAGEAYDVNSDTVLVEVLNDDGPAQLWRDRHGRDHQSVRAHDAVHPLPARRPGSARTRGVPRPPGP